jgi:hypothetical protein
MQKLRFFIDHSSSMNMETAAIQTAPVPEHISIRTLCLGAIQQIQSGVYEILATLMLMWKAKLSIHQWPGGYHPSR